MEKFKKLIAVVLSVAILISTLIIGGAMATDTVAVNDYTGVESELLSETFVFDFDMLLISIGRCVLWMHRSLASLFRAEEKNSV